MQEEKNHGNGENIPGTLRFSLPSHKRNQAGLYFFLYQSEGRNCLWRQSDE